MSNFIEFLKIVVFGLVEGFTEWLPISSTGHLILADEFIHMSTSDAFKEMFDVVIQFGAILAVVVIFWSKLWPFRINRDACGSGVSGLVDRYCRKDVWTCGSTCWWPLCPAPSSACLWTIG